MPKLGLTIKKDDCPESRQDFTPIPAGWYQGQIKEAELKDTKSGTGKYIRLRIDVLGPSHAGRVIFCNLNIQNDNDKAEEIGRQQLGALMGAIGIEEVDDTDQLVGGACDIKVKIREAKGQYEASNDVSAFRAPSGGKTEKSEGEAKAPPWAKK